MWILAVVDHRGDFGRSAALTDADRRAVRRMATGDEGGLAELYDRHARLLYSLALRIVRERGDAEDVIQEVFSQIWRQAHRFDVARGTVAGWLVTVTRSRALDRLRRRKARPESPDGDLVAAGIVDPSAGIDLQLVTAEAAERVRTALAGLPADQRVPLELAYYEGLSQSEIAATLATPLGTIKTRMREALRRLRGALAGEPS
jgi:RNA polymerase sigma-70 factor (ECF subfamily)